jgi:hypothetical protein
MQHIQRRWRTSRGIIRKLPCGDAVIVPGERRNNKSGISPARFRGHVGLLVIALYHHCC